MNRKLVLACLPVLLALGLAAVWLVLNADPADSPHHVGKQDAESSPQPPDNTTLPPNGQDVFQGGQADGADAAIGGTQDTDEAGEDTEGTVRDGSSAEDNRGGRGSQPGQSGSDRSSGGTSTGTVSDADTDERQAALEAERARREREIRSISRPRNQNRGNTRPRTRALETTNAKPLSEVSEELRQDRRGLLARYYNFDRPPLDDLLDPTQPTLEQRTPDVTRIDRNVHFPSKDHWSDLPFDLTNFMAVWEGFLVIPEDGEYWLFLGVDLHGRVVMGGETVLLNTGVDYTVVSTTLTLEEGLHPIRIEYTEAQNNSPVSHLGACNFMWVPDGETAPVPIPPEMLMLPERYWSDNAPIITRLSTDRGEIGDEITIHGRNFLGGEEKDIKPKVNFAGTPAEILDASGTSLRVRVPIGATTGTVTVFGTPEAGMEAIPSNSEDFTVTTQFGLFASWHNLQGWANYDFLAPGTREPDVERLEANPTFEQRSELDLAFRNNPLAATWEGKLGLPRTEDGTRLIRFAANGRLRVTLGGETRATQAPPGTQDAVTTLDFEITEQAEHYLPLSMDLTAEGASAALAIQELMRIEGEWQVVRTLPPQLLFPPVTPPEPPRILSVTPLWPENEPEPILPYDRLPELPSVREGQQFEFVLEIHGNQEVRDTPIRMYADGVFFAHDLIKEEAVSANVVRRTCRATLPAGLGEGHLRARLSIVTSDAFKIDVTNKGLIAYLYKYPPGESLSQLPDIGPLTCWEIRKDRWINFENANDFNLPFPSETFVMDWYGALIVEEEGDYIFTTRSDDGVIVWLDGAMVVDDDGLHYQREMDSEPIRLSPGVYPLRVQFFENFVHEVCVLYWRMSRDDEEIIPRQVIPKRHYTWDIHPPLPSKTSTGLYTDGTAPE
jgi:hypothetical protein